MHLLLLISVVTCHVTCSNAVLNFEQRDFGPAEKNLQSFQAVTRGINKFSPNFYETVGKTVSGNFVCSPLSISMLLSMICHGAQGNTKEQLLNALAFPRNTTLREFQAFIDSFKNYHNVQLLLANKIYLANDFKPKREFTNMIGEAFRSKVESLNFDNPLDATRTINGWCSIQTNNLIENLFGPDDIKKDSALVLVSAVYFKGNWAIPFNPAKTQQRSRFYVNNNTIKHVPMMTKFGKIKLGELPELNARFIELPYKSERFDDSVSMFIVLPNEINADLAELEKDLKEFTVEKLLLRGRTRTVYVGLPRFKIESEIPVKDVLVEMGVTDIFNDNANFSGIVDSPPLKVSKVVQKVFIEVNEKGSEAAAASGSTFIPRTITKTGLQIFFANHPFISIIATKGENPVNLFIARYAGP